jgi:uncharacterized membrane protein
VSPGLKAVSTCTVARPIAEVFQYWRRLEHLPEFMQHLECVTQRTPTDSHWVISGGGIRVQWDAVVFNEHRNELIAWRSRDDAPVPNAGSVRLEPAPLGEGTEVTVSLEYMPPGGSLSAGFVKLFGKNPNYQLGEDLRRFKALMEAGEIPTTRGQPAGYPSKDRKA